MRQCGRVDVLYNNGARTHIAPFLEMTASQWQGTPRLESDVVFFPTKAVWPHMLAQKSGSIINIASIAGLLGGGGMGAAADGAGKGGSTSSRICSPAQQQPRFLTHPTALTLKMLEGYTWLMKYARRDK